MSEDHDESQEKGFSVSDKRRFDSDGAARRDGPEQERADDASTQASQQEPRTLPAIDFSTFVLSLSTSVMVHLGEAPMPDGTQKKDLQLAKQTIDILALLKEKTQGNLTEEENKLLGDLLYDLRIRYVSAAR
jgi:hypothetical protein